PTRRRRDRPRREGRASRSSLQSDRRCVWGKVRPYVRRDLMNRARIERERRLEHRSRVEARVELAVLAARIEGCGQLAQQRSVELASGERAVDLTRVDACEARAKAPFDHLLGKLARGNVPHRKQRLDAGSRKLVFAIASDVLQKQIAERRMREA